MFYGGARGCGTFIHTVGKPATPTPFRGLCPITQTVTSMEYKAVCIMTCPECQGTQVITDPTGFWGHFWEGRPTDRIETTTEFNQRFLDTCASFSVAPEEPPVEETPCDCGTGTVRTEVPLLDALLALGYPTPEDMHDRLAKIEKDALFACDSIGAHLNE